MNNYTAKLSLALEDILSGLKLAPSWLWISWNDIKQRYKRSVLGPFWLTLALTIQVVFMGILYSKILKVDIREYMPVLASGLINWTLISTILIEGAFLFSSNEGLIKQVRLPYSFHILRMISRNVIIWLHNIGVLFFVKIFFWVPIDFNIFWILVSIPLVCVFGFGFSLMLGMLAVRYRDLQQMIVSLVQILFFITPVMWVSTAVGKNLWVLKYNIFYYFLELMRQPFNCTNILSNGILLTALGITFVVFALGIMIFSAFRSRIAYWI